MQRKISEKRMKLLKSNSNINAHRINMSILLTNGNKNKFIDTSYRWQIFCRGLNMLEMVIHHKGQTTIHWCDRPFYKQFSCRILRKSRSIPLTSTIHIDYCHFPICTKYIGLLCATDEHFARISFILPSTKPNVSWYRCGSVLTMSGSQLGFGNVLLLFYIANE